MCFHILQSVFSDGAPTTPSGLFIPFENPENQPDGVVAPPKTEKTA